MPRSVGAITLRHSSFPLRESNATATSFVPSEKSVTARPPATAIEEYPVPSAARQATAKPPPSIAASVPEAPPSWRGPRRPGHS